MRVPLDVLFFSVIFFSFIYCERMPGVYSVHVQLLWAYGVRRCGRMHCFPVSNTFSDYSRVVVTFLQCDFCCESKTMSTERKTKHSNPNYCNEIFLFDLDESNLDKYRRTIRLDHGQKLLLFSILKTKYKSKLNGKTSNKICNDW